MSAIHWFARTGNKNVSKSKKDYELVYQMLEADISGFFSRWHMLFCCQKS
jgi:hypothetical protein